jgi:hypothetical protein
MAARPTLCGDSELWWHAALWHFFHDHPASWRDWQRFLFVRSYDFPDGTAERQAYVEKWLRTGLPGCDPAAAEARPSTKGRRRPSSP